MNLDKDMLQQLQEQMLQAQENLKNETITVSAGGGAVQITITGDQRITALVIDPAVVSDADAEMLQDLLLTAMNTALEDSRKLALDRLGPLSSGIKF